MGYLRSLTAGAGLEPLDWASAECGEVEPSRIEQTQPDLGRGVTDLQAMLLRTRRPSTRGERNQYRKPSKPVTER